MDQGLLDMFGNKLKLLIFKFNVNLKYLKINVSVHLIKHGTILLILVNLYHAYKRNFQPNK
jgi:hypothetical protein